MMDGKHYVVSSSSVIDVYVRTSLLDFAILHIWQFLG